MIDFNVPNFESNSNILLDGMCYADLPDILDWKCIKSHMQKVLEKIENEEYRFYDYDADGFIKDFKSIASPDYIRYVDDMVFFSDSKQELEMMVSDVQRILGKYMQDYPF